MTYLELVNKVLLRLREPEAATVEGSDTSTQYARLIGEFVNDAKAEVEAAADWSALRTTLTLTTSADVFNYELNGTGNNFKILNVINDTSNWFMEYRDGDWFDKQLFVMNDSPQTGAPQYYNFNGVSADGDTQVDLYPIPDQAYSLRFNVTLRNPTLTLNEDTVVLPTRPIILLATAKAIEERGEDGGQQSMNAYAAYRSVLADEIALDGARHPEDSIWYPV